MFCKGKLAYALITGYKFQTSDDDDQLHAIICVVLITDEMYGFANFVEQHLVPYEYASISLVVIEASMWLL